MTIRIASAQYPVTEHASTEVWQKHCEKWVKDAAERGAGLLLFPEYGSMELVSIFPQDIRSDLKKQLQEMQALRKLFCHTWEKLARTYEVTIVAPNFPVAESGKIFNRTYVFSPAGIAGFQDKFFMTRFEDEEWGIHSAPKTLAVFESSWGSFGIQTCYDSEFPIGSLMLCKAGAQVILAPSCTETPRGAARVHTGCRARALENQAYVVVSQTVGNAQWSPAVDINYGFAGFYATPDVGFPEEGILATGIPQEAGWVIEELDLSLLEIVRTEGNVLNFRDQQTLSLQPVSEEIRIERHRIL